VSKFHLEVTANSRSPGGSDTAFTYEQSFGTLDSKTCGRGKGRLHGECRASRDRYKISTPRFCFRLRHYHCPNTCNNGRPTANAQILHPHHQPTMAAASHHGRPPRKRTSTGIRSVSSNSTRPGIRRTNAPQPHQAPHGPMGLHRPFEVYTDHGTSQ
jgi:hypothetical protein